MPAGWTFRPGGDSRTTPRIRRQNMFCSSPAPGRKYPGTVLRNRKVQPPSGLPVYAVIFQKVQAALGCVQPFLSYAIYMAQVGVGPAAAPLHPHAFICGVNLSLTVQAGINAAMDGVHAVFQPKIRHILQLILNLPALRQKSFPIHIYFPPVKIQAFSPGESFP